MSPCRAGLSSGLKSIWKVNWLDSEAFSKWCCCDLGGVIWHQDYVSHFSRWWLTLNVWEKSSQNMESGKSPHFDIMLNLLASLWWWTHTWHREAGTGSWTQVAQWAMSLPPSPSGQLLSLQWLEFLGFRMPEEFSKEFLLTRTLV